MIDCCRRKNKTRKRGWAARLTRIDANPKIQVGVFMPTAFPKTRQPHCYCWRPAEGFWGGKDNFRRPALEQPYVATRIATREMVQSLITNHFITNHQSPITNNQSPITNHLFRSEKSGQLEKTPGGHRKQLRPSQRLCLQMSPSEPERAENLFAIHGMRYQHTQQKWYNTKTVVVQHNKVFRGWGIHCIAAVRVSSKNAPLHTACCSSNKYCKWHDV